MTVLLQDKIDRIIGLYRCLFLLMENNIDELKAYTSPPHQDLYLQIEDELTALEKMLKEI